MKKIIGLVVVIGFFTLINIYQDEIFHFDRTMNKSWNSNIIQKEIEEFQNYLPQPIFGISEVISASYDSSRNTIIIKDRMFNDSLYFGTDTEIDGWILTNEMLSDYRVEFLSQHNEWMTRYINDYSKKQTFKDGSSIYPEDLAIKLDSLKSIYNLEVTVLAHDYTTFGTIKIE